MQIKSNHIPTHTCILVCHVMTDEDELLFHWVMTNGGHRLASWQARRGMNELLSYIYIYMCVCVCVCVCEDFLIKVTHFLYKKKNIRCNLKTHDLILGYTSHPNTTNMEDYWILQEYNKSVLTHFTWMDPTTNLISGIHNYVRGENIHLWYYGSIP